MQKLGIPCVCLPEYSSGYTTDMQQKLLDEIVDGSNQAKAIFLTPEKLEADAKSSSRMICDALKKLSLSKRLGMIVRNRWACLLESRFPECSVSVNCACWPLIRPTFRCLTRHMNLYLEKITETHFHESSQF